MNFYDVTYAARKVGAIGVFSPKTVRVSADAEHAAREEGFRVIHDQGFETREPMGVKQASVYSDLKAAGIKTGNHESDLYAPDTPEVRAILERFPLNKANARPFTVQEGHPDAGQRWLDIPFAFDPFWEKKQA
jgi:hypothetical protein